MYSFASSSEASYFQECLAIKNEPQLEGVTDPDIVDDGAPVEICSSTAPQLQANDWFASPCSMEITDGRHESKAH